MMASKVDDDDENSPYGKNGVMYFYDPTPHPHQQIDDMPSAETSLGSMTQRQF